MPQTAFTFQPLFTRPFLLAAWSDDFEVYRNEHDDELRRRLDAWGRRRASRETSDEASLITNLFSEVLSYQMSGSLSSEGLYHLWPQYPVSGAGAGGGVGKADLAIGYFGTAVGSNDIPQVLCEFKDIRSGLDTPQKRRGNTRSPVQQCFDYLRYAFDSLVGGEPVRPSWGIVTDMNEFRLYHRSRGPAFTQRFVIEPADADTATSLLADTPEGAFERFTFLRMLSPSMLLAEIGSSPLEKLLQEQWIAEKAIERDFYLEYRDYRAHLFQEIRRSNPDYPGTPGRLVRLTQRLLDRLIFILFCEDMGSALAFPRDLLRNMMADYSTSAFYDADSQTLWTSIRELFDAMNTGGTPAGHTINKFNGGLFEREPELESLRLPASLFCAKNQGGGGRGKLEESKKTLLYFSASYNFGIERKDGAPVIDLYMLGRIFEQSITELEIMEAEVEGRPSINLLSKRKRDGVYYTPEPITQYIVEETVGTRLKELRSEYGLLDGPAPDDRQIDRYRKFMSDPRRKAGPAAEYLKNLRDYSRRLESVTVLDPACGSGAFLVQTLRFLLEERRNVAAEIAQITGQEELWDQDAIYRSVLSSNIFGVDINPESVEITRLALWLHTALPGRELTSLDETIRCGNSLVGSGFADYFNGKHETLFDEVDEVRRERINAFDWQEAFPRVFERGGFDCIVGNPPYVKLQNFRIVESDVAEFIVDARTPEGEARYRSAQTGNFDLYLPFIEMGTRLLRPEGVLGFIAPNLWLKNSYGEGLRSLVRDERCLDRWVDFGSHQVFEDATTYTALQFFRGGPTDGVRYVNAPTGDLSGIDWSTLSPLPWEDVPDDPKETWILVSAEEKKVMEKMEEAGPSLQEFLGPGTIIVGIQTSADAVYHLHRLGPGRYVHRPGKPEEREVEIEEGIMKPLVSGPEAKRYREPRTDTWLLFPYDISGDTPLLIPADRMVGEFPKAWAYLRSFEEELRGRERGKFDDEEWYRFGRNQSIDKQECSKLLVPRITYMLQCCNDVEGAYAIDNVDVGGILASPDIGWYLTGILNSRPCNFYWRRISKPFRGDYRAANKQFIAPLPIPDASEEERRDVAGRAEELQRMTTELYDRDCELARRLGSGQCTDRELDPSWFWSEVRSSWHDWKGDAPAELKGGAKSAWAREARRTAIDRHLEPIDARLFPGVKLAADFSGGELRLHAAGTPVIDGLYLDDEEGAFILAQWRHALRNLNITEKTTAQALLSTLSRLRTTGNDALRRQVIELDRRIADLVVRIDAAEAEMEEVVGGLYGLDASARTLISSW